ncbi:hypothetical protein AB0K51_32350 [Kitasatospora sp. NPDC049285]|uniref:hypothetical protein n=1 Tax=Kitasatospora sp. NPDC049285 TaxID=3157096 RepID=UPI003444EF0C
MAHDAAESYGTQHGGGNTPGLRPAPGRHPGPAAPPAPGALVGKTETTVDMVLPVPGRPGQYYVVLGDSYARVTLAQSPSDRDTAPEPRTAGGVAVGPYGSSAHRAETPSECGHDTDGATAGRDVRLLQTDDTGTFSGLVHALNAIVGDSNR